MIFAKKTGRYVQAILIATTGMLTSGGSSAEPANIKGVVLSADSGSESRILEFKRQGINTIVLVAGESTSHSAAEAAAKRVRQAKLKLFYWIEVGRSPALADAHPEWVASLQGHPEWRRFYPDLRQPKEGEVVKNYPWVPVLYKEAFDAHLARISQLLKELPSADGLFLNDLQGPPSACGCGHILCRWTADYGPITTATRLPDDAAAQFVSAVRRVAPELQVIPVWATECEAHDSAKDGACAGVGCFNGTCWLANTSQLMPLADKSESIGALLLYKVFGRDDPRFGAKAGWVKRAIDSFALMPPQRKGKAIPASRIVAILQGWGVTPEERRAQIERAREAGAGGYVIAETPIDQSWQPRIDRTGAKPPQ